MGAPATGATAARGRAGAAAGTSPSAPRTIESGAFGPAGALAVVLGFGAEDAGRPALRAVGAG
jgi:hypothetical protein